LKTTDEKKENEYSELIKKHGPKKASEIIRGTGAVYDGDFTKSHKDHPTFSNETTAKLIEEIEGVSKEVVLGTGGGRIYEVQSNFELETQSIETITRKSTVPNR